MIRTKKLENGVRVIVKRMEGLLSVSMGVLVGTGAAFETDREDGISHFIEHMLFKGTARRSAGRLAQLLSALQTIHAYNLACRTMDYRHVLMTERNRFRIGSVGVMDILEPHSTNQDLQAKDLYQLGSLLVVLGCRGVPPDIKTLAVHYSEKFVKVMQLLLSAQTPASAVLEQCTTQIVKTLNSSLSTCDTYYNDLVE